MKMLMIALAVSAAAFAIGSETRYVEVRTTNDVASIVSIPEWRRGADTNGITVTVCVGIARVSLGGRNEPSIDVPLSRDLTFDADGRLSSASKIGLMRDFRYSNTASEELLEMIRPHDRAECERIIKRIAAERQARESKRK